MKKMTCAALGVAVATVLAAAPVHADTSAFTIIDDAAMNSTVATVRSQYLATRTFTRLNATILVKQTDGTWRRGSYNPDSGQYPASCVKLSYMAAAMYWCRINGKPYTYLDADVRPMIVSSDNNATGRVVDAISGVPNYQFGQSGAPTYSSWVTKRFFAENFLSGRGLLGSQRALNKTYPTNSGSSPSGYESQALSDYGANSLQAKLSASLMLEIVGGAIEPGATSYMRELLTHDRWDDDAVIGPYVPPGSVYLNKLGVASGTTEDIAYVKMPNGKEFILAVYTDGYNSADPLPYDAWQPGPFAERLIDALGLYTGNPTRVIKDDASGLTTTGTWTTGTVAIDKYSTSYKYANGGSGATATFALNPATAGTYEVAVWFPDGTNRATNTPFAVTHKNGTTTVNVDQTTKGGLWVKLGNFEFNAGSGSVRVGTTGVAAGKIVLADAVRASLIPAVAAPIVVDNTDPGFSASTNWFASTSTPGYLGANYHARATASVSDAAVWTVNLPTAGNYKVSARWTSDTNRSTTAPFQIIHSGGTATVSVNQQANGGAWQVLGTYNFAAGSAQRVKLSCWTTAGLYVVADGVKFEAVP